MDGLHAAHGKVGLGSRQTAMAASVAAPTTEPIMTEPNVALVKEVFEQWAMYDAVVRNDYMHHAELVGGLGEWAKQFGQPLRIVDLGSSDSWLAANAFRDVEVEHYLGVDLAESSIERARSNVHVWGDRAELVCGNLANVLAAQPDRSANLALASYSIHHFSTDDKITLISEVWRLLTAGGAFVWIDAVRRDGELRETYIDRLTASMATDWTGLTVDQRERGVTHVRNSDFPETKSWMLEHVEDAGFEPAGTLLSEEFFDGWVFVKP
jgi:ubiquinone/menaquinone biosynthesis C-methylase UbiE